MPEYDYAMLAKLLGIKGRLGTDQLVGLCPLHRDRKPSFSLNIHTGLWTCFSGCGAGSFTQLVSKINGVSIRQAHDWVLRNADIIPEPEPEAPPDMAWRVRWHSIGRLELPQWWFDRGFTWEDADCWDIRWDEAQTQLVIPFYHGDELLGTISRNLVREFPKYINSPKLPRSKYLFGLAQDAGPLILLVEGPLDAIWLVKNQIPSAALLGLNMSQDHILAMRGIREICLALDNDFAGQTASYAICDALVASGRLLSQVTTLRLPKGIKDAGECPADELRRAVENREGL